MSRLIIMFICSILIATCSSPSPSLELPPEIVEANSEQVKDSKLESKSDSESKAESELESEVDSESELESELESESKSEADSELESESTSDPTATLTQTPAPTVSVPTLTATKVKPPTATSTQTPSSSPTPTQTSTVAPTNTPEPVTHIVVEGETLYSIAFDSGLTIPALAEANGVDENDFLSIGQTLIIPVIPEPTTEFTEIALTAQVILSNAETISGTQAMSDTTETTKNNSTALVAQPVPIYTGSSLPDIKHAPNINPLTGLPVDDPTVLQRRPILIRIGNDIGARQSQAGFNQAEVVYEEITEWWITRFTAIFLAETPNIVAPIRSARLINVLMAPQYQGALAHSGGSDPVRWEISQAPFVNLDEFYSPAPYFYRPNQGWQTRLAVDVEAVRDYLVAQNNETDVDLPGFRFSSTAPSGEDAQNIFIPYPRSTSSTEWRYNSTTGLYQRWIIGSPLMDVNDGQQVSAANVIVYFAPHQETDIIEDSNGATAIRMLINGQGTAMFFRDGVVNEGFWQTDGNRPPYFIHANGTPYDLKPGNSWIQVVPTYYTIGINDQSE